VHPRVPATFYTLHEAAINIRT